MVKDKIIQMDNGKSYYVLDETSYNEKKYLIAIECDLEKDDANEEDYLVMELAIENNELAIKRITDDNIAKTVTKMLLEKIINN